MQQLKVIQEDHFAHQSSLDEIARQGARELLKKALEQEVEDYIQAHSDERSEDGRRLVVRKGKGAQRTVTTSAGRIQLRAPRISDGREGEKFTSSILPPYLRKSPNLESLVPILYLKGLSTAKFSDALTAILGEGAKGFSASSVVSLKRAWEKDIETFRKKRIDKPIVYLWADGVNVKVRLGEDKKVCLLVVMGVTEDGEKQLLSVTSGYRESKDAWLVVLRDLIARGMGAPLLAIADGALGFWAALGELEEFKDTKIQRCWFHKMSNVLNSLPKRLQGQAKYFLQQMIKADSMASANASKKQFDLAYKDKYPKAFEKLDKDWDRLTTFFSFPGSHWQHIRTSNPVESCFASVKLRTKVTRGAGSVKTAETMAFKLLEQCEKKWRKICSPEKVKDLLVGVEFKDGLVLQDETNHEGVA